MNRYIPVARLPRILKLQCFYVFFLSVESDCKHILDQFLRKSSFRVSFSVQRCILLPSQLGDQCSAFDIYFYVRHRLCFFEFSAISMLLSFFTVITTGLINRSSRHFSIFIVSLFSISFINLFSVLSSGVRFFDLCVVTGYSFVWTKT